jgi:hypothetical protein
MEDESIAEVSPKRGNPTQRDGTTSRKKLDVRRSKSLRDGCF